MFTSLFVYVECRPYRKVEGIYVMANRYAVVLTDKTRVSLTKQEQRLGHFLAMGFSKEEAYCRAGYKDYRRDALFIETKDKLGKDGRKLASATNRAKCSMILKKNPDVSRYYQDQLEVQNQSLNVSAENLMKLCAVTLELDIADLYAGQTDVYNKLMKIPPMYRKCIKKIDVRRNKDGVITDICYETYDKIKVMDSLVRLKELFSNVKEPSKPKLNRG